MSDAEVYRITSSSKLSKAITLLKHEILLKFRFALVYTVWQISLHCASNQFTRYGKLIYTMLPGCLLCMENCLHAMEN